MDDFVGKYFHSLDSKSRLVIPAAFREKLGQEFIIAKDFGGRMCLSLYPGEEWERIKLQIAARSSTADARKKREKVYDRVDECSMDPQNRVIIKDFFKKYGKLGKNVVISGHGAKIDIRDEDIWNAMHSDEEDYAPIFDDEDDINY